MKNRNRRAVRTVKVNRQTKPTAKQLKVRRKKPANRTPEALRTRRRVKAWRKGLDSEGKQIRSAIESAGDFYRRAVRGYTKVRPKVREKAHQRVRGAGRAVLQSPMFDDLTKLIPVHERAKPDNVDQEVVFLLPNLADAHSWMSSIVVKITQHKDSNLHKPSFPLFLSQRPKKP